MGVYSNKVLLYAIVERYRLLSTVENANSMVHDIRKWQVAWRLSRLYYDIISWIDQIYYCECCVAK